MIDPARNQLVWLGQPAWAWIDSMAWDAQALDILDCWRVNNLPMVVTRERGTIAPERVCVGLPAPQKWSRRRLALTIERDHVAAIGHFPTLMQMAQDLDWEQPARDWVRSIDSISVSSRVYGSHGWQRLTGMAYVHPDSDLDLSLAVGSWAQACALARTLDVAQLPAHIDGEIVLAGGQALAWRELGRLLAGQTASVLVKERHRVWLATLAQARALADDAVSAPQLVATPWN